MHSAKLFRCSRFAGASVLSPQCFPATPNRNLNEPEAQCLRKVSCELVLFEVLGEEMWAVPGEPRHASTFHG